MYEKPELNHLGKAQDVILGAIPNGEDLDHNWFEPELTFAADTDSGGDDPAV